jgi:hypothetical protein
MQNSGMLVRWLQGAELAVSQALSDVLNIGDSVDLTAVHMVISTSNFFTVWVIVDHADLVLRQSCVAYLISIKRTDDTLPWP